MEKILNIASMLQNSRVSGPGLRDLIWVQGCSIACKGCFNKQLWSYTPKHLIPVDALIEKFRTRVGIIEGVTFLGGEPSEQAPALSAFLEGMQGLGLSTVVYTGRTYEYHLQQQNPWVLKMLKNTDILIDGPYVAEKNTERLLWRGSTNQRILFLSERYDSSILRVEASPNQELHLFVDDHKEICIKTGIN